MIYTIGYREHYERFFKEQETPQKLGRIPEDDYPGGWVWKTFEEARASCPLGYSVYGVKADWETGTVPGIEDPKMPGMRHLLVTSDLVRLSNQE